MSGHDTLYDIKLSLYAEDHGAWYLLDGRAVSSIANSAHRERAFNRHNLSLPNPNTRFIQMGDRESTPTKYGIYDNNKFLRFQSNNIPRIEVKWNILEGSLRQGGTITSSRGGAHYHQGTLKTGGAHVHNVKTPGFAKLGSYQSLPVWILPETTTFQVNTSSNELEHTHTINLLEAGKHTHTLPSLYKIPNTLNTYNASTHANPSHIAFRIPLNPPYIRVNTFIYLGD